jgi:hypothetical protein
MHATLQQTQRLTRKFHFRLWLDRLDLRDDAINLSDRTLRDMGLSHRCAMCPVGPFWIP